MFLTNFDDVTNSNTNSMYYLLYSFNTYFFALLFLFNMAHNATKANKLLCNSCFYSVSVMKNFSDRIVNYYFLRFKPKWNDNFSKIYF